jgi:hypothetical protein
LIFYSIRIPISLTTISITLPLTTVVTAIRRL